MQHYFNQLEFNLEIAISSFADRDFHSTARALHAINELMSSIMFKSAEEIGNNLAYLNYVVKANTQLTIMLSMAVSYHCLEEIRQKMDAGELYGLRKSMNFVERYMQEIEKFYSCISQWGKSFYCPGFSEFFSGLVSYYNATEILLDHSMQNDMNKRINQMRHFSENQLAFFGSTHYIEVIPLGFKSNIQEDPEYIPDARNM